MEIQLWEKMYFCRPFNEIMKMSKKQRYTKRLWFAQRFVLYQQLCDGIPPKSKVKLVFRTAAFGWTDLDIYINGRRAARTSLTCIFEDPVKKILLWIESICDDSNCISSIGLDCEGHHCCFYFEKLMEPFYCGDDTDTEEADSRVNGIFSYYDSNKGRWISAICDTQEFVRGVYENIQKFAQILLESDENLINWSCEFYLPADKEIDIRKSKRWNEHVRKSVIADTHSDLVENFLSRED